MLRLDVYCVLRCCMYLWLCLFVCVAATDQRGGESERDRSQRTSIQFISRYVTSWHAHLRCIVEFNDCWSFALLTVLLKQCLK